MSARVADDVLGLLVVLLLEGAGDIPVHDSDVVDHAELAQKREHAINADSVELAPFGLDSLKDPVWRQRSACAGQSPHDFEPGGGDSVPSLPHARNGQSLVSQAVFSAGFSASSTRGLCPWAGHVQRVPGQKGEIIRYTACGLGSIVGKLYLDA